MSLIPDITEQLARVRADLRMGVPVVVEHAAHAALILTAETLRADRLAAFRRESRELTLAITARRAETLKARAYDGDLARVIVPDSADLTWIRSIADPSDDLNTPMKGPLRSERAGTARLHRMGIALAKAARLLPAVLAIVIQDGRSFSRTHDLTRIDHDVAAPILLTCGPVHPVVQARLPIAAAEAGRLHMFRPGDGGEDHYAIEIGRPDRAQSVLARLHSACFTGDVLGSLKCDCGSQLHAALNQMGHEGAGILLYLQQEGRGIGLTNKIRAYSLQDQGFDTVEANHRLGFEDDERDFRLGADILKSLGFSTVRLLTNNPRKIRMMEKAGIRVSKRVPLKVGISAHNRAYLATKAQKSGHLL
ncbi:MAG: GTP cyclohydrolase II [Rhodobacteraceae bacterium]|nr:GTP cyclohydrolase II [Paracoccaceae bacterium]